MAGNHFVLNSENLVGNALAMIAEKHILEAYKEVGEVFGIEEGFEDFGDPLIYDEVVDNLVTLLRHKIMMNNVTNPTEYAYRHGMVCNDCGEVIQV